MTQLSLGTEDQADEVNEAAGDFPFPASGTTAQHSDESDDDFPRRSESISFRVRYPMEAAEDVCCFDGLGKLIGDFIDKLFGQ